MKFMKEADKDEEVSISTKYMGAPKYRIKVTAPDYKSAEESLKEVATEAIDYIENLGGTGKYSRV